MHFNQMCNILVHGLYETIIFAWYFMVTPPLCNLMIWVPLVTELQNMLLNEENVDMKSRKDYQTK